MAEALENPAIDSLRPTEKHGNQPSAITDNSLRRAFPTDNTRAQLKRNPDHERGRTGALKN